MKKPLKYYLKAEAGHYRLDIGRQKVFNWNKEFRIPFGTDKPDPNIYINEDGNEIQLENSDKGKSVTLEVPFTSIGFSAAGLKEKEPQHHSIQGGITFGMTPNAKMEFKSSDEIKADISLGIKASAEVIPASENKLKKGRTIKGKVSLKGTANLKVKASLRVAPQGGTKFSPASENKETDSLAQKLPSWSFILPKKFREEFVGDLLEDRANLKSRGLPKGLINVITFGNLISVLITSGWIWFQNLLPTAFKYLKEFIQ